MARLTPPSSAAATVVKAPPPHAASVKKRAAALSIASNVALIVAKIVAGVVTGSVAILTEVVHSGIDLIASFVAFASVRMADEPADESHHYGHAKVENLAAVVEGMLIVVGAGVIVYAAVRRLISGAPVHSLGFGIAVVAGAALANVIVSTVLMRRARETDSPALEGDATHLRTDAATSAAVLVGLVLVQVTGANWIDPTVALIVAAAIVFSGARIASRSSRVLVDAALPHNELDAIRDEVLALDPEYGVIAFHALRARRAGARRYVDLHVQFRDGTTLEDAHGAAHQLQDAIRRQLGGADVLIHIEPADRVRPGTELPAR